MDAYLLDWLNLLVRWAHIVAGIMWIGNSFLFVWLDSALHGTTRAREGDVVGEIWLVHSGGFYEVVKRRSQAGQRRRRRVKPSSESRVSATCVSSWLQ